MRKSSFRWSTSPRTLTRQLERAGKGLDPALQALAGTTAARAEGEMKAGASWNDITGFARAALYARPLGTSIEIGTTNTEYGIFLELGTVYMAPRPIIGPVFEVTARRYFEDAVRLARSFLGG